MRKRGFRVDAGRGQSGVLLWVAEMACNT